MRLFGPSREELVGIIAEAIEKSVVRLDPEHRYLLLLPDILDDEFDALVVEISEHLDIKNSNLRFAVVSHPNVKLLEF